MPYRVLVGGHRGYRDKEIENTLAAFKRAIKERVDFAEFDVLKTRDGVPVVFHDRRINRLLNGKGFLKDFTLAELKRFTYEDGQKILTLEEYFQETAGKIRPMLEIKALGIEGQILRLVKHYDVARDIIIQSFSARAIRRCHKTWAGISYALNIGPILKLGPLGKVTGLHKVAARFEYLRLLSRLPVNYIHPDGPFVYDDFIHFCNSRGKQTIIGANRTWDYVPNILKWQIKVLNCDNPEYVRGVIRSYWRGKVVCA